MTDRADIYEYGDPIPETADDAALAAKLAEREVTSEEAATALSQLRLQASIESSIGTLTQSHIPILLVHVLGGYERGTSPEIDVVLHNYGVPDRHLDPIYVDPFATA